MTVMAGPSPVTTGTTILGFIKPNGSEVHLRELLENEIAYDELVKYIGIEPTLNISAPALEGALVDLTVASLSIGGVHYIQNLTGNVTEEEGKFIKSLIDISNDLANVKFHRKFTRFGTHKEFIVGLIATQRKEPLGDRVMNSPKDIVSFVVPPLSDIKMVYGDNSWKDSEEVESLDGQTEKTSNFAEVQTIGQLIDYAALEPKINTRYIPVNRDFPYYDSISYRDILQKLGSPYPIDFVAGSPDNNFLDIQSNEQDYYNALVERIREGIADEYGVTTSQEVDELVAQGKTSTVVNRYLQDLCSDAYNLNWTHAGAADISIEEADADEEGDTDVTVGVTKPGYYRIDIDSSGQHKRVELIDLITRKVQMGEFKLGIEQIKRFCNTRIYNSYVWAEALIRLLRWGENKPSHLCIKDYGKDKPEYFDLNKTEVTTFAGNFGELTPEVNATTGAIENIDSIVWTGFAGESITDRQGASVAAGFELPESPRIPLGVAIRTNYSGQTIYRLEYIDIFTFALQMTKGDSKYGQITFDAESNSITLGDYAADRATMYTSLSDVLTPRDKDVITSISQSPDIAKSIALLTNRLTANFKDINMFSIMGRMYNTPRFETAYDMYSLVDTADAQERIKRLAQLKAGGKTETDVAIASLIPQVSAKYFALYEKIKDKEDVTLPEILQYALLVQEQSNLKDGPVRASRTGLKIKANFTAGVTQCVDYFKVNIDGLPTYFVGVRNIGVAEGNRPIRYYYVWTENEWASNINVTKVLPAERFKDLFVTQYQKAKALGKLNVLEQQVLCTATDQTLEVFT